LIKTLVLVTFVILVSGTYGNNCYMKNALPNHISLLTLSGGSLIKYEY